MFLSFWRLSSLSDVGCAQSSHWFPMLRCVLPHLFVFCLAFFFCSLSDAGCARSSHWLADAEVCVPPFVSCSCAGSVGVEVELRSMRFHFLLLLQVHIVYGASGEVYLYTTRCHASRSLHSRGFLCLASFACMCFLFYAASVFCCDFQ